MELKRDFLRCECGRNSCFPTNRRTVTHEENENPLLSGTIKLPEFKERIVTGWRRFSSGLWRVPEGDIAAAYCGDQFPKLKTFIEGGKPFTTMGMAFLDVGMEATCHPLLPAESV